MYLFKTFGLGSMKYLYLLLTSLLILITAFVANGCTKRCRCSDRSAELPGLGTAPARVSDTHSRALRIVRPWALPRLFLSLVRAQQ